MARAHRRAKPHVEDLQLSDAQRGSLLILEHYLERVRRGDIVGVMVVGEKERGGVELKLSGTANVAERLGRLELLKDAVLEQAEDVEDDDD